MIETQLGLTALAALAPAAAAEDGEERFRAALGEVAEHMAEREWDDAHEALLEALEEHGEAPYVRLHRARIEQDLLRCLFWRDREEPDPRSLVSGELHKYSPSTGQLRLDYTPSTMGDFQWISDEGEVSDRPGKERVRFHPAVFQSDYSVEVEGDDYDPDVGFLVCVDFPLRYFAANLGQRDFERGSTSTSTRRPCRSGTVRRCRAPTSTTIRAGSRATTTVSRST